LLWSGVVKNKNPVLESLTPRQLEEDLRWWEIYNEAFPQVEREPPEVILLSLQKKTGLALRARVDDRTIGVATAHLLADPPVIFMVYLAIDREERNQGYGRVLFDYLKRTGLDQFDQQGLRPLGLIWEVDIPALAENSMQQRERDRRIAFFSRLGAMVLPFQYSQPPVDGLNSIEMHLMFLPFETRAPLDPGSLRFIVRSMYFEKYHSINGIPVEILEELFQRQQRPAAGPTV
jgi:GNAT superfamily N-acetyltransferase